MVFDPPMVQIFALYLDFEGAKNIHVLKVLIWGFGGCWMFLTVVWILIFIWIWTLVLEWALAFGMGSGTWFWL